MRKTWVWSLGWKDPLEKGKATHSGILPREFHGLCCPWGCKESDTTEQLSLLLSRWVDRIHTTMAYLTSRIPKCLKNDYHSFFRVSAMRLDSLVFTLVGISQYAENQRTRTNFTEWKIPLTFFQVDIPLSTLYMFYWGI